MFIPTNCRRIALRYNTTYTVCIPTSCKLSVVRYITQYIYCILTNSKRALLHHIQVLRHIGGVARIPMLRSVLVHIERSRSRSRSERFFIQRSRSRSRSERFFRPTVAVAVGTKKVATATAVGGRGRNDFFGQRSRSRSERFWRWRPRSGRPVPKTC